MKDTDSITSELDGLTVFLTQEPVRAKIHQITLLAKGRHRCLTAHTPQPSHVVHVASPLVTGIICYPFLCLTSAPSKA